MGSSFPNWRQSIPVLGGRDGEMAPPPLIMTAYERGLPFSIVSDGLL